MAAASTDAAPEFEPIGAIEGGPASLASRGELHGFARRSA
jgi:hypothetical protein